jgi:hypothetical protein
MSRSIILAGITVVILSACQISPLTLQIFEIPSGEVLFQDDFSDPGSGWDEQIDDSNRILDYFDGYYRIQVKGDHQMLWTGPAMQFTDVHLESEMIKVIGSSDDTFGLVCRAEDPNNYYFFVISSDGYYGIGKSIDGVQELINVPGMLPAEQISQGKARNHLRADCIGEKLELFINGQGVAVVNDSQFTRGRVGILAGTLEALDNAVLFDNFSVLNP